MKISELKLNPNNPRIIKDDKFKKLVQSLKEFPEMMEKRPLVCVTDSADGRIFPIGGNMRLKAMRELGMKEIPDTWVVIADEWTEEQRKEFTIKDNASFGEWNWDELVDGWDVGDLEEWGVDVPEWEQTEEQDNENKSAKLSDRFIIPPFSVFDTRQAYWQDRKKQWLSLGIRSELGRDASFFNVSGNIPLTAKYDTSNFSESTLDFQRNLNTDGVSIFDPVLTEVCYKWFNIDEGKILDPFAGGSVRGIVASVLGYEYLGNDLREEQINANRENAKEVLKDAELYPVWTTGDSTNIDKIAKDYKADMIFSCPPYADLEVYSDDERDISNMKYNEFLEAYREIIRKSVDLLNNNRFAVFVISEVRDKKGNYYNFVGDTVKAFTDCGLHYYNEIILYNAIGNLAMRAGKYMNTRKVGRTHQNVLVFFKGDPKTIKSNYGKVEVMELSEQDI